MGKIFYFNWEILIYNILYLTGIFVYGQNVSIRGIIIDSKTEVPIPGAAVMLKNTLDTNKIIGVVTDKDGNFKFNNVLSGNYKLQVSFLGYKMQEQIIKVKNTDIIIPPIKLVEDIVLLKEITVETNQVRVEQKGDTTEINANAYKTNPDATAEDLVKKNAWYYF
ncbi:MAG TPA: carboxypeptidase-like regulatory domain-containing protein [Bacteroidales bacterium]|nr:carboxypeptidase-like regulatory domain-containing protein [Bacteroidales bacterium]